MLHALDLLYLFCISRFMASVRRRAVFNVAEEVGAGSSSSIQLIFGNEQDPLTKALQELCSVPGISLMAILRKSLSRSVVAT